MKKFLFILLLALGNVLNAMEDQGLQPIPSFLDAVRSDDKFMVEMLLDAGVDISEVDGDGNDALALAIQDGHDSMVNLLLERCTSASNQNYFGHSPLMIALTRQNRKIIKALLKSEKILLRDAKSSLALARKLWRPRKTLALALIDPEIIKMIEDYITVLEMPDYEARTREFFISGNKPINKDMLRPMDDIRSRLIDLIKCEQKSIKIAVYFLTDDKIVSALIEAHNKNRNLSIEVILDGDMANNTSILSFAVNHIKVWIYNGIADNSLMHHKFCIFEDNIEHKTLLWTGSYNFTDAASTKHQEGATVREASICNIAYYNALFTLLKTFPNVREFKL